MTREATELGDDREPAAGATECPELSDVSECVAAKVGKGGGACAPLHMLIAPSADGGK